MGKNYANGYSYIVIEDLPKQEGEMWKNLANIPHACISSMGRVHTLMHEAQFFNRTANRDIKRTFPGRLIEGVYDKDGYRKVLLNGTTYFVHRLVASSFLPNIENKPCVNHIDGNKQNNMLVNLEWCTRSENDIHAFRIGLRSNKGIKNSGFGKYNIQDRHTEKTKQAGEGNSKVKLTEQDVLHIRELAGTMLQQDIANIYGVSQVNISCIICRKTWAHI